jgi:membrane associated rhomboid family serine protease
MNQLYELGLTPAVTVIIMACVVVWLAEQSSGHRLIGKLQLEPQNMRGRGYTWFTSLFTHAIAVPHLLFNMFALYRVGPTLESYLGTEAFLVVYFVAGFAGNALFYFWTKNKHQRSAAVGASGAIYGLIGAVGVIVLMNGGDMSYVVQSFVSMIIYSFISRGICWQAHVGGFIAGGISAALLLGMI